MLTMNDLETFERRHYAAVCAASETGGLSLVEVADESARLTTRLLHELRTLLAERPYHREVRVPYSPVQAKQQVLPFARA
jgi:hypothetical protein